MIISNNQVQSLLKTYAKQLKTDTVRPKPEVVSAASTTDNISISGQGKLMQKAIQAAKQSEDVRGDLVQELKEAVASGTYTVSDQEAAEKMIYRALVDKMV